MGIHTQDWNVVRNTLTDPEGKSAFARIEADVERLIQEHQSMFIQVRDLRTALEEPGGAELHRR